MTDRREIAVDDALTGKIVDSDRCSAGHPAGSIIYGDREPGCGCTWWPARQIGWQAEQYVTGFGDA